MPTDSLLGSKAVRTYLHDFTVAQKQYESAKDERTKAVARLRMKHISREMTRTEAGLDGLVEILSKIPTRSKRQEEDLQAYRQMQLRLRQMQVERAEMTTVVEKLQTALMQERNDHNETRQKLNQAEAELHSLQQHIFAASIAFRRMETNIQRYIAAVARRNPDEAMEMQQEVMSHEAHHVETRRLEHQIAQLREELQAQGQLASEIAEESENNLAQLRGEAETFVEGLQKQNQALQAKVVELQNRRHTHLSAPDQMFNTPATHTDDDVSDTARFVVKAFMVIQHATEATSDWLGNSGADARYGKFVRILAEDVDLAAATKRVTTSIRRAKLCGQADQVCHHLWYVQQLMLNACGAVDILARRVCSAETKDCENDVAIEPLLSTLYQSFDASEELVSFLSDICSELADVSVTDALFASEAAVLGQASSALTEFIAAHKAFCNLAVQSFTDKYSEARQFAMKQKLGPAVHRALALWSVAIARLGHMGFVAASGLPALTQDLTEASLTILTQQNREMEALQEFARQSQLYLNAVDSVELDKVAKVTNGFDRPWFKASQPQLDLSVHTQSDNLRVVVTSMLQELAELRPHWVTAEMGPGLQLLLASVVLDTLPTGKQYTLQTHRSIIQFDDADLLAAAQTVEDVVNICRARFRGLHAVAQWDRARYVQQLSLLATPASQVWQTTALTLRSGLFDSNQSFNGLSSDPLARELLQTGGEEGVNMYRQRESVPISSKQKAVHQILFCSSQPFPRYDAQEMPNDTQDTVDQRLMMHLRNAVTQEWQKLHSQLETLRAVLTQQAPVTDADQALGDYITIWLTKGLVKDSMHQDMLHRISTLQHMMAKNTLVYQRQARQMINSVAELRTAANASRHEIMFLQQQLQTETRQLLSLQSDYEAADKELKLRARRYEALRSAAKRAGAAIESLETMPATQDTVIVQQAMQGLREADNNYIRFNQMALQQLQEQEQQAQQEHQSPEHVKHITDQLAAVRATIAELQREQAEDNGRDYETEQVARQALATANHLKRLLATVNAELVTIEREKHKLANSEQVARSKVETQAAKIKVLETDLAKARSTLDTERKAVHKVINQEVEKALSAMIPSESAQFKELEEKLAVYNDMLKKQRDEYIDKELQLTTNTAELRDQIAELQKQITRLKSEREQVDETNVQGIRAYNDHIRAYNTHIEELETKVKALEEMHRSFIDNALELHGKLDEKQQIIDALQVQLRTSREREAALTTQHDEAVHALANHAGLPPAPVPVPSDPEEFHDAAVEPEEVTLRNRVTELERQLADQRTHSAQLEQQLAAHQAAAAAAAAAAVNANVPTPAQVADLQAAVVAAQAETEQAKAAKANVENSVKQYVAMVHQLNTLSTQEDIDTFLRTHQLPNVPDGDIKTTILQMLQAKAEERKLLLTAAVANVQALDEKYKQTFQQLQAAEAARTAERTRFETTLQQLQAAKTESEVRAAANVKAVRTSITVYDEQSKLAADLLAQARAIVQKIKAETLARFRGGQGVDNHDHQKEALRTIAVQYDRICQQLAVQHEAVFNATLEQSKQELRLAADAFLAVTDPENNVRVNYNGREMTASEFMNTEVVQFLSELAPGTNATTPTAWDKDSQHDWQTGPQAVLHRQLFEPAAQRNNNGAAVAARERLFDACQTVVKLRVAHVDHKAYLSVAVKDMYMDMFDTLRDLDMNNLQIIQAAKREASAILQNFRAGSTEALDQMLEEAKADLHEAFNNFSSQDDYRKMFVIANKLGIIQDKDMPAPKQTWGEWFSALPASLKRGATTAMGTAAVVGSALAFWAGAASLSQEDINQYNHIIEPIFMAGAVAAPVAVTHGLGNAWQNIIGPQLGPNDITAVVAEKPNPLAPKNIEEARVVATESSEKVKHAFDLYLRFLQLNAALGAISNLKSYQTTPHQVVTNVLRQPMQNIAAQAAGALGAQATQADAQLTDLQAQVAAGKARIAQLEASIQDMAGEHKTAQQKLLNKTKAQTSAKIKEAVGRAAQKKAAIKDKEIAELQQAHTLAMQEAEQNLQQAKELAARSTQTADAQQQQLEQQFQVTLNKQIQLNEQALAASRAAYVAEEEKFREVLQRLSQRIVEADLERQKLNADKAGLQKDSARYRQLYDELHQLIPYSLTELQQQLENANARLSELEEQKKPLQEAINKHNGRNYVVQLFTSIDDPVFEELPKVNEAIASAEAEVNRLKDKIDIMGSHLPLAPSTDSMPQVAAYQKKLAQLQAQFEQKEAQTVNDQVHNLETFRQQVQAELDKQVAQLGGTLDEAAMQRFKAELQAHADSVYSREANRSLAAIATSYAAERARLDQQRANIARPVTTANQGELAQAAERIKALEQQLRATTEQLEQHQQQQQPVSDARLADMLAAKTAAEREVAELRAQLQQQQTEHDNQIATLRQVGERALADQEAKCQQRLGVADPDSRQYFKEILGTKDDAVFDETLEVADGRKTILWLLKQALLYKNSKYYFGRQQAIDPDFVKLWITLYSKVVGKVATDGKTCDKIQTVEGCFLHGNTCIYNGKDRTCQPLPQ